MLRGKRIRVHMHAHTHRQETGCSFHGSFCRGSREGNGLSADGIFITPGSRFATKSQLRSSETAGTDLGCATHTERIGTCRGLVFLCLWWQWRPCLQPVTHQPHSSAQTPARNYTEWATNEYKTVLSGFWVQVLGVASGDFHGPSRNLWALLAASVAACQLCLRIVPCSVCWQLK